MGKGKNLINRALSSVQIPMDIALRLPNIEITGNRQVYIENYKSILEYESGIIRLKLKNMQMIIEGKNLVIDYYTQENMLITGSIKSIKFAS